MCRTLLESDIETYTDCVFLVDLDFEKQDWAFRILNDPDKKGMYKIDEINKFLLFNMGK